MAVNQNEVDTKTGTVSKRARFSLDTWAVVFALVAALLVRFGVIKHIPW
jgi:hypothetical protein